MCLIKNHKFPYITIFPKTVYKLVEKTEDKNIYKTSYRHFIVKLGKTYKGIFYSNNNIFKNIKLPVVNDGFIHSYNNIIIAKHDKSDYEIIIKCKIPSFTLYYKGISDDIASRKLKYIKVCQN